MCQTDNSGSAGARAQASGAKASGEGGSVGAKARASGAKVSGEARSGGARDGVLAKHHF